MIEHLTKIAKAGGRIHMRPSRFAQFLGIGIEVDGVRHAVVCPDWNVENGLQKLCEWLDAHQARKATSADIGRAMAALDSRQPGLISKP